MFSVSHISVSDIDFSMWASGFPKATELENLNLENAMVRAERLASSPQGSGHDCFLKGITVNEVITAPQYFWLQWQRYSHQDIVSSQSKMHRITKMDLKKQTNSYVDREIIKHLKSVIDHYNDMPVSNSERRSELFQRILSNTPMGLELSAGITTNYLQLKTIYNQRKNHRLEEWQIYCAHIESLPESHLITGVEL